MAKHKLPQVLIPFDRREAITLAVAAARANKSAGTVRQWCLNHAIGRRVGGGTWQVSAVALAMFLDRDASALFDYLSGCRTCAPVRNYYVRLNLGDVLAPIQFNPCGFHIAANAVEPEVHLRRIA